MLSETQRMAVQPARKPRKCIATVALSGTLPDKLEAAAAVGFDGVEIMESDLLSFDIRLQGDQETVFFDARHS